MREKEWLPHPLANCEQKMKQWDERADVSATEIDGGYGFDSTLSKCIVDVGKGWACVFCTEQSAAGG